MSNFGAISVTNFPGIQPVSGTVSAGVPALGQALATASLPVVLTAAQLTTLTPPAVFGGAVTGTFWQTTQPVSIAAAVTSKLQDGSGNAISSTSGALNVNISSGGSGGGAVTNAGTFAVQVTGSTLTDPAECAIATTTAPTKLLLVGGKSADGTPAYNPIPLAAGSASVVVSGTFWQATQPVSGSVTTVPATSGGWSSSVTQAMTDTAVTVKSSAGQLGGYIIFNPSVATCWVFFYNVASPSIGSTTSLLAQVGVPAGGGAHIEFGQGIAFSTGIYAATSSSSTSAVAPATALQVTVLYK